MPIAPGTLRAVSFDFGNVLGVLDAQELAGRIAAAGGTGAPDAIRAEVGAAYARYDAAIADGQGHERGWRAFMGVLVRASWPAVDAARCDALVEALWAAQRTRNLWREVPPEARALLAALAGAGVPVVVTTNSEGRAEELITELGLRGYVRGVVDSGRVGVGKPDRRIFDLAAAQLGVPLEAVVHVGDSEHADVEGARAAGAAAIRFEAWVPNLAGVHTAAHARARTYAELRALLAAWLGRAL